MRVTDSRRSFPVSFVALALSCWASTASAQGAGTARPEDLAALRARIDSLKTELEVSSMDVLRGLPETGLGIAPTPSERGS